MKNRIKSIFISIPLGIAVFLALSNSAQANDCERGMVRPMDPYDDDCETRKPKEKFDSESGLEVIEIKSDLDWKVAKPKLPYSKIVKRKSELDGGYELFVFDRDYSSSFI